MFNIKEGYNFLVPVFNLRRTNFKYSRVLTILFQYKFADWQNSYLINTKMAFNPSRPNPRRREKNNLNFYFLTSLWSLKRFYEGFKGFHKTF